MTKTKKHGDTEPTYPDGYLFDDLHDFIEDCNDVVKFFHNHHAPKAQLSELQKTTNVRALVKAAPTCWGTIKDMAKTLLQSKQHLHAIVTARDFVQGTDAQKEQRKAVRDTVTYHHSINNLKKTLAILHPVDGLIVKFQSDTVSIWEGMPNFHVLPNEFAKLHNTNVITKQEAEYLVMLAKKRFQFMYGEAHNMSYLFDPVLFGEGLPGPN
jgi:hypothetical protein